MNERTAKCPICGRIYPIVGMTVRDQTRCPSCEQAEKHAANAPDTQEQIRKRDQHVRN